MAETGPPIPFMGYLRDIKFVNNNTTICWGNPKTIVVIISRAHSYQQRRAIRATWAKSTKEIRFAFLLGLPATTDYLWKKFLSIEMEMYGDIIQVNMEDKRNKLKTGAMIKWVHDYCLHAKYVIKINDDTYLDAEQFTSALDAHLDQNAYFMCRVFAHPTVERDPKKEYYVSRDTWPLPFFPNHCSGPGYGFTANIIPDMWRTALQTTLIINDDVWWTGIIARRIQGVKHFSDERIIVLQPTSILKNWCETKLYIMVNEQSPENLLKIWQDKLDRLDGMAMKTTTLKFKSTMFNYAGMTDSLTPLIQS
ncbi:beta-1,3-galactosyltransferase 1-like [Tubulanus polymorphus]|uniref:beta-1,3-galactosyltransferase 1-like n=1 Tax=Tubulanus polymorphus TaxID=672921 RepID=UPI003DA6924E